jgi:thioesterase domain-containing protein
MPIMTLRDGDPSVTPLVCVHPVSGRIEEYRPLAGALDWPGPVLAIAAPDPGSITSLAELAQRYREEIAPRTRVRLLGWALGGVIAAELARSLVATGSQVELLALLDSRAPVPEMKQRPTDRDTIARFFMFQRAMIREQAPPPPPRSSAPEDLLATLRAAGLADDVADEAELEQRFTTYIALTRALFEHDQQPVPVPIHLFESSESHPSHPKPPTLGWDNLTPRLHRELVPGTHFTLLAPRRVDGLARVLSLRMGSGDRS